MSTVSKWVVCQLGAREHYAVPRAFSRNGILHALLTDAWVSPNSPLGWLPRAGKLRDRWHRDLRSENILSTTLPTISFEIASRMKGRTGWEQLIARNENFQRRLCRQVEPWLGKSLNVFAYSYAARRMLSLANAQEWLTAVGQIDPGPEEERIVQEEHQRQSHVKSQWHPAPKAYWDQWHEEMELADRIVVNSEWSRTCLQKVGIDDRKIAVIPLVYEPAETTEATRGPDASVSDQHADSAKRRPFQLLFLGQINLRKGVARLIEAMRLLKSERRIQLTLAGPTEIDPKCWADLTNVRWVGPVRRSEVAGYYRSADAFILPTLSDGYALTQLEALAYGTPVIASRHCGEAVSHGQNGWVLDDLEPQTIAEAIHFAAENPLVVYRAVRFGIDELGLALGGVFTRT